MNEKCKYCSGLGWDNKCNKGKTGENCPDYRHYVTNEKVKKELK